MKLTLTDQDKAQMANLLTESQVLNNLLAERRAALEVKAQEILNSNALSPKLYALKFNPGKDLWEAELKRGQLIVPGKIEPSRINLS